MLKIQNLNFHYGKAHALNSINLEIKRGKITILVGSNGAGKSTIMRCISGIIRASSGHILLEGRPISTLSPSDIVQSGVIQVPEGRKIFPSLTVDENLDMGSMHSEAKKKRSLTKDYVFDLFPKLRDRKDQIGETLSGGEQQMLAIGRALMGLPKVLLLDEPSIGLAPLIVQQVFEVLRKLNNSGSTIFLVEQNLKASLALCNYAYVIESGNIVLEGTGEQLLSNEKTVKAYLGIQKPKQKGVTYEKQKID
jgi:branched-chain amino acid transport system ATP-binding protein